MKKKKHRGWNLYVTSVHIWCLNIKTLCSSFLTFFGLQNGVRKKKMPQEEKHVWMICAISENFRIPIANFEANVPKGSEVTTCSESSSCFLHFSCVFSTFFTHFCRRSSSTSTKIILILIQFAFNLFYVCHDSFSQMYFKSHLD